MSLKSLLHVGPDCVDAKKQLPELTKAIVAVLNTAAGDAVKQEAIRALGNMFSVNNTVLSGNYLSNNSK